MTRAPSLFIPHGGGPLPLLGEPHHQGMVDFLRTITARFPLPSACIVISAHWEEPVVTLTGGANPSLIYDYYGFPPESYTIQYPAPGSPALAAQISDMLQRKGIPNHIDAQRGFDHGMFVPLKLMYPDANIPCVQMSLLDTLDAEEHIRIGHALASLRDQNILILGSGFSFHNLRAMMSGPDKTDEKNVAFEEWLMETFTEQGISLSDREKRLIRWEEAPHARYCHPREEHLLPLHVCFGAAGENAAKVVFHDRVFGKLTTGLLW